LVGTTLLAKEPIGSLRLSHFSLINRSDLLGEVDREGTPEEVSARIPNLKAYLDAAGQGYGEPEIAKLKAKVPRWVDLDTLEEVEYDLVLYDFSKIVWEAVPGEVIHSTDRPRFSRGHLWDFYDTFACLFDKNGNLTFFYEGVADFYNSKVIIVEELTVQRNDEKSTYFGITEEGEATDSELSVLSAPDRGTVHFEDLRRNDRVAVMYSLDSSKLPTVKLPTVTLPYQVPIHDIIHIVAIGEDEGEPEYIVNTHEPPKPEPES
jgi:hypothetical protein